MHKIVFGFFEEAGTQQLLGILACMPPQDIAVAIGSPPASMALSASVMLMSIDHTQP